MRAKRILAFVLMITIFMGNTVSVSATASSVSGNEIEVMQTEDSSEEENQEATVDTEAVETEPSAEETLDETISGNELSETKVDEETTVSENDVEVFEEIEAPTPLAIETAVETENGPIYAGYWGLPDVLTPTAPTSSSSDWTGDLILDFGICTGTYSTDLTNSSYARTDIWKILDPSEGLLWAAGTHVQSGYGSDDTEVASALTDKYLSTDTNAWFTDQERAAIKNIRLLTSEEAINTSYGFSATLSTYMENSISKTPAIELDTDRIFMTLYDNNTNDYVRYDVTEYSSDVRAWNVILKSDDAGFSATLPDTLPYDGYFTVDVTALGSLDYDGISMAISDESGALVAYNSDLYDSEPALGEFEFAVPTELQPGTYILHIFEEKSDEAAYDVGSPKARYAGNVVEKEIKIVGPEVTNLSIDDQVYGETTIRWDIENKASESFQTYTYCDIYRAEKKDGVIRTYELIKENYACDNSDSSYRWDDTNVIDSETGKNKIYSYKVVMTGGDPEDCDAVTNEGLPYRSLSGDTTEYKRIYIAEKTGDEYVEITSLTMRPEEYKELYIVMEKEDGSVVIDDIISEDQNGYSDDSTSWFLCSSPATGSSTSDADTKEVDDSGLEFLPINEEHDWNIGYAECSGEFAAGKNYFMFVQRSISGIGRFWVQIPVKTASTEDDDSYTKIGDGAAGVYLTAEALSQAMRDDMVARKPGGTYYVSQDAYYQWGGVDEVYDFAAEREGMLPVEGDYLRWQCFDPEKVVDYRDGWLVQTPIYLNGKEWWKIELEQVYYTTAEKEAEVTNKIEAILKSENGDLNDLWTQYYKSDGNYTTAERKAIADACCDYVYKNVTYKGTVTPKYHSAWSALTPQPGTESGKKLGIGTCQAYSLVYTRLLREFGIKTKILTGTDANYHTYNIVQIDAEEDRWYYYDATNNRQYQTEDQFSRTKYQDMFVDNSMFIQNYISKIVGSPYEPGISLYGDGEFIGKYFEMAYATEAMYEDVKIEGREATKYTIKLTQDAIMSDHYALSIDSSVAYCEVDLNGYQLTLSNGGAFRLDCLKNGTLYQPLDALPNRTIFGCSNGSNNTTVYKDLTLNVQSAYGELYIQTDSAYDSEDDRIICQNIKTSEISYFNAKGNVYMDEESDIKVIEDTYIYGTGKEHNLALLGTITTDGLLAYGNIDIGTLTVNGRAYEVGSDSYLGNYYNTTYDSAIINIYDELNVKGHLGVFTANKSAEDSTKQDMQFNLVQSVDGNNNDTILDTGKLSIGSEGINVNFDYVGSQGSVVLGKKIVRITDDTLEDLGYVKFDSGETMATIQAKAAAVPTSGFILYQQADKETIIRTGNALIAAKETVNVNHTNGATGVSLTARYTSLEAAIASLATDFGSDKGTYIFTFVEPAKMNASVTIPSFVQKAVFCGEVQTATGEEVVDKTLDFNGFTINASIVVEVENSLKFINTSKNASKLNMTGANGSENYVVKLAGTVLGVEVSASKGTILLEKPGEEFADIDSALSAKEVVTAAGKWNVKTVNATTYTNKSVAYVNEVKNVTALNNMADSVLVVDSYIPKSSGTTNLQPGSKLVIKEKAQIYNAVIGAGIEEAKENACVYRMENSQVSFDGKVTTEGNELYIDFGVLDADADIDTILSGDSAIIDLAPNTILFTSNIKVFPVELFEIKQESVSPEYASVYQQGNNILIGREWITVYSQGVDGTLTDLEAFIRWQDAAAYLETLSNSQMEYVVEIAEDVELFTDITLPKKVTGIIFRGGNSGEERITLTYTGDIRLASNTTFENMDLVAKKYNSSTKSYDAYQSAVTLNGMTLTMKNASADFASITGNNKSRLVMEDAVVNVAKAVLSLGYLDMVGEHAVSEDGTVNVNTILSADNVAVTDTLTMQSAKIDCVNKIALKNIITKDSYNILFYGGNTSKDMLTITGNVTASDAAGMEDETVTISRTEGTQNISKQALSRKNAIRLQIKSMEAAGYSNAALLCNAEKAGAGWFVVGSKWAPVDDVSTREVTYGTYKNAKAIYCGEIAENVKLYSADRKVGNYAYESSFVTLQDALSEIDRLAVNTAYYRIELLNAEENVVTFNSKTPTFPAKTAGITIAAGKELTSPYLYFKGNLSLKCDTTFEDITFMPQAKSTVSLGNFELVLERCFVDPTRAGVGFTGITGSGVNGTSALTLSDTALAVAGTVNNVGTLKFTGEIVNEVSTFALVRSTPAYPTLIADGTVNVGSVELEKDGYLTGLSTVTRKNGQVIKIVSQITINKEVYSASNNKLYLDLQEKVSNKMTDIDFDTNEMTDIRKNGLSLAKAPYVTYPNIKAAQRNEGTNLVKSGSYLTYFEDGFGVLLSYEDAASQMIETPCRTFNDAVTEINNQKTKRDYTITLFDAITEFSGVDQSSGAVPIALTMPNKNYVETLTIQADEEAVDKSAIKLGFLNNITLTSNVVLKNVNFVQMIKNGSVYQTSDFVKDDYPAALTFNTAGYNIEIEGENTFNTPLNLNGGNKSSLTFNADGTITTFTNDYNGENETSVEKSVIYGMLSGFDTVTVNDCDLILHDYKTSRTATSYTESKNKITTVNVFGTSTDNEGVTEYSGNIEVNSNSAKAEFVVTNYNSEDGSLFVEGKVNLKNVSLEGDAVAAIHADTNFDITGTLISRSDKATLETRLKSAGKEPYLNVSGTVVRVGETGPVTVKVYPEVTAVNPKIPVNMKSNAVSSKQLLVAKTAQARDFMPSGANYAGGEYDADGLTDGYMMLKTGDKIYVYNGSQVALAVYKGDYPDGENTELLGYYPTFAAATTDVNALKDKTQKYAYVLTKQNGTMAAPVAVSLPSQAESVTVTKLDGNSGNEAIYLSGNVSLQCATTFENIEFAPVNKGAGTAFSISASGYDVALENVTVSNESDKMALKDISGNGKQTIKLASPELEMSGGITNALQVEVSEDITIKGNVKSTTLALLNNASGDEVTCAIGGTVTLDYLENKDDSDSVKNTLVYARNSSNVTNLTINKDIINDEDTVLIRQNDSYKLSVLNKKSGKVDLSNAAKAFVLPKTSTDSFVLEADCTTANNQAIKFSSDNVGYTVVKADKGVYIADSTVDNDIVLLKKPVQEADEGSGLISVHYQETNCLDYSQAINEINTLADVTSTYAIRFMTAGSESAGTGEIDTNVKDSNRYGTFPLPKANTYSQVVVVGVENGTTVVPFTGNISGQGSVTLQNLVLNPVKGGNDATPNDTKISITKDKKSSDLTLENISTKVKLATDAKATGFIASISGTRNETAIFLNNCGNIIVKSGISNVNDIHMDGTKLLSDGTVTVNFINLINGASWDSLGKMTVTDVYTDSSSNAESLSYIGTKQDKNGIPQFVLNGNVYDVEDAENEGLMLCKLYNSDTTIADGSAIFAGTRTKEITDYANVSLVSAKKADADKIRAYDYRGEAGIISYKDGVYVKNGDLSAMQIKLTEREQTADGHVLSTSYAVTFEDAVTAINNKANANSYYDIEFIQPGTASEPVVIKTTKKGTEYGALTLPTKAAGVTISGYLPEGNNTMPCTVIKYTGTLKSSCNVKFENILLTEGKTDKTELDGFAEYGTITPAPGNNYTLAFGEKVYTYQGSVTESVAKNSLAVNAINSGKGKMEFHGNNVVTDKTISIGTLTLLGGAKLQAVGKVTVTDLVTDDNVTNSLTSDAAIAITNIKNWNEGGATATVNIHSDFTKITKAGTFGNSQLSISGLIDDVNVKLSYDSYDLTGKTYEPMNANAFTSLVVKSDAKPDTYKKLATVPKASLDYITIVGMDVQYGAYNHTDAGAQTYLYKYETGLYLTDLKPVVLVNGYEPVAENEDAYADEKLCYQAEFLSWDQAVKEIEKINEKNRYYKMILLDSIGYTTDAKGANVVNAPIGTVSMPSKAAEVWVTSQESEQNGIFFTGTNFALKCNTRMDNVGFTCVKKYGSGVNTYYAPITYTMNIGNFKLTQEDMVDAFVNMTTVPYTVSGSAKGIFELVSDEIGSVDYAAVKGMNELIVDYTAAVEPDGGNDNFTLDCTGDLNVKNINISNSTVAAKNITVSTLATLDEGVLQAGTSDKNDGKMSLKDIKLVDNGNALRAEQNNSGATQITISGTVSEAEDAQVDALADGTLEITLYYNNYKKGNNSQKPAQLYNGMILCTTQKVASDLFVPAYTQVTNDGIVTKIGMGKEYDGYGLYKSGKNICYGKIVELE